MRASIKSEVMGWVVSIVAVAGAIVLAIFMYYGLSERDRLEP
jgi:hypothetical protein